MPLDSEKIAKKLKNKAAVHVYGSIDSTNNEAKRRAGTDGGIRLYATTHQTAGRGRRGRSFYSPKDTGLYMTLALPLCLAPADVQKITCAAAVAVCETVEELSDKKPMIKWVNDIFIDGRKAAGILAELICGADGQPSEVIVGIGLNLNTESFPDELADIAGNIGDIEPEALCAGIADRLIDYYNNLGDISIIEKYSVRNLCVGREVFFTLNGKKMTAAAVGIDSSGGLIVKADDETIILNSGEVSVKL